VLARAAGAIFAVYRNVEMYEHRSGQAERPRTMQYGNTKCLCQAVCRRRELREQLCVVVGVYVVPVLSLGVNLSAKNMDGTIVRDPSA